MIPQKNTFKKILALMLAFALVMSVGPVQSVGADGIGPVNGQGQCGCDCGTGVCEGGACDSNLDPDCGCGRCGPCDDGCNCTDCDDCGGACASCTICDLCCDIDCDCNDHLCHDGCEHCEECTPVCDYCDGVGCDYCDPPVFGCEECQDKGCAKCDPENWCAEHGNPLPCNECPPPGPAPGTGHPAAPEPDDSTYEPAPAPAPIPTPPSDVYDNLQRQIDEGGTEINLTMYGNTMTISLDMLRMLADAGRAIRISLDIPEGRAPMQVLLPVPFIEALLENEDEELFLTVFVEDFFLDDVFSSAVVTIAVNDDDMWEFTEHYYVFAYLGIFDLDDVNTYRIVAQLLNPAVLGGIFNVETGYFIVAVNRTGSFAIAYNADLLRLSLSLSSNTLYDLAGNAPSQFMDATPEIQNGHALVPIRFIAQALGAEVTWTPATEYNPLTIHLALYDQTLSFAVGETTPELAALGMAVTPEIMDDRVMVPLQFVSEFFGALIDWDGGTNIKIISSMAHNPNTDTNNPPPDGADQIVAATREEE